MVIKLKIRKKNDQGQVVDCVDADKLAPYCGFLYAMWKDIMVDINHHPVYTTHGYYDLMTYLKILFTFPNNMKDKQMLNALWYQDAEDGHSMIADINTINPGQYYRMERTDNSASFEMSGKLILDCLDTERPMPENVSIGLKFYLSEAKKCILIANQAELNPVIEIEDFYLIVPRIHPKSSLLGGVVKIPWMNTSVQRFMFPSGSTNFGPKPVIHADSLPRKCILAVLTEDQLNGNKHKNRQQLKHHNIEKALITVNGKHLPVINGYATDFPNGCYSFFYDSMFTELGDPDTVNISREAITGGFAVWGFDLSEKSLSSSFYPAKKG